MKITRCLQVLLALCFSGVAYAQNPVFAPDDLGDARHTYGTADPNIAEKCINSWTDRYTDTDGMTGHPEPLQYVCISPGSPGTWKVVSTPAIHYHAAGNPNSLGVSCSNPWVDEFNDQSTSQKWVCIATDTWELLGMPASEVVLASGSTVEDVLGNWYDLIDYDGDGSVYELCTGVGTPVYGCKAPGQYINRDFPDDANALLQAHPGELVNLKLRCNTRYTGVACWNASDPNIDPTDPETRNSVLDDSYQDCVEDENGAKLWHLAVRGNRLRVRGCGFDERKNDTGNMGPGTERPTGDHGTVIAADHGNQYDLWFTSASNNPYISVGFHDELSTTLFTNGFSKTGSLPHAFGTGKGLWAITMQQTLASEVHKSNICLCNSETNGACGTGVRASATDAVQTLTAGDRLWCVIPLNATTGKPVGIEAIVAGVAASNGGNCNPGDNIVSESSYSGGTATKINTPNPNGIGEDNIVTIAGTTSYNGTFTVYDVTTNSFVIPVAFVSNEGAVGTYVAGSANAREVMLGTSLDTGQGTSGLAWGYADDWDGTGPAYCLKPDDSYWTGQLFMEDVALDYQDPWNESGGICTANPAASETGKWLFADGAGVDSDDDCDTNPFFIDYGGTVHMQRFAAKDWGAYMFDGGPSHGVATLGPHFYARYGYGEALFDASQFWRIEDLDLGNSRLGLGVPVFGFFGGFTTLRKVGVHNIEAGTVFPFSNAVGHLIEDLRVWSSKLGYIFYLQCGSRDIVVRHVRTSGIDAGHTKTGTSVQAASVVLDCQDPDNPITMNLIEDYYDQAPGWHRLPSEQISKIVRVVEGSNGAVVNNTFAYMRGDNRHSDSTLFVVDGTTPTAAQIATLAFAHENTFIGNTMPNGHLFGYVNKGSGYPNQPALTTPIVFNGAGNAEGIGPAAFDPLSMNAGTGGPLATRISADSDIPATETGDKVCAAAGLICVTAFETCLDLFDTGGPPETSGVPNGKCDADGSSIPGSEVACNAKPIGTASGYYAVDCR